MDQPTPSRQYTFAEFINKFPQVTMPVTLGEHTHHTFDQENETLPHGMIQQFIHPVEGVDEDDEFTEYMPCFSLSDTGDFVALVWWKAGLLNYEYTLATFKLNGALISKHVIAFTRVAKGQVHRAVATIDEDWEINIALGSTMDGNDYYDPTSTKTANLEILEDGHIIDYLG